VSHDRATGVAVSSKSARGLNRSKFSEWLNTLADALRTFPQFIEMIKVIVRPWHTSFLYLILFYTVYTTGALKTPLWGNMNQYVKPKMKAVIFVSLTIIH